MEFRADRGAVLHAGIGKVSKQRQHLRQTCRLLLGCGASLGVELIGALSMLSVLTLLLTPCIVSQGRSCPDRLDYAGAGQL